MATPTSQLLSRTLYDTDGVTTVWDFSFSGGYLDPAHVRAYVENPLGVRTDIVVTEVMLIGEFQLQITPALAAGDELVIYRDTPKDLPLVDFTDEAGFSEVALDTNAKQAVFIAAEAIDVVNATDVSAAIGAAELAVAAQLAAEGSAVDALASQVAAAASAAAALASANAADASEASALSALADALTVYGSIAAVEAAADAAAASAAAADSSETQAGVFAANALASETAAAASAGAAATSAGTATTQAGIATTQAGIATTQAAAALASANAADVSEAAADASEAAAAASAASSAASLAAVVSTVANFPGRNKIINGKMDIAQAGASFASASGYTLDQWSFLVGGAALVTVTQQLDNPVPGITNSLRATVTSADASIAAGDAAYFDQIIEGYSARELLGRTFTLSFWVRSAKTGIHCVSLRNAGSDRAYVAEYTINVANTYEKKTITVTDGLPSAGTWNYTNGQGLRVGFTMMAGTTFQTSAGAWNTGGFLSTVNQVNVMDTVGNIFAITGVQLEVGTVASPFEHIDYALDLMRCRRYFLAVETGPAGQGPLNTGFARSTTSYLGFISFPTKMRTVPTYAISGVPGDYAVANSSTAITVNGTTLQAAGPEGAMVEFTVASGMTAGDGGRSYAAAGVRFLYFSARL